MTAILNTEKSYDTSKQVLRENQIVVRHGQGVCITRYVVYKVEHRDDSYIYHLVNVETREFRQTDLVRPLHEQFGIGFYYDAVNPEFMDAFEVAILRSEALQATVTKQKAWQSQEERNEQLKTIGKERLEAIVPDDVKAVIVAELHKDESMPMLDYFGHSTQKTVILGFSNHTKDLFSEMRKYAVNFTETACLAEENKKYEHREKYTGGEGYYLGESKYYGWIVKKVKYYKDRHSIIDAFALIAGDEANVCVKVRTSTKATPETVSGDFIIVDYSEKALAVFGDTKAVKDQLKALGGRFNPKLTHEGQKKAGWIFSKSKEQEIRNLLLTVK
jgi:hypothetical protein